MSMASAEKAATQSVVDEGLLMIGLQAFATKPGAIRVFDNQKIESSPTLRQYYPTQVPDLYTTYVSVALQLAPAEFVKLVRLLRMYRMTPFVPVSNLHLNRVHQIYAVALQSFSVNTVEGFPGELMVSLGLLRFNHNIYLPRSYEFMSEFNLDLFEWYTNDYGTDRFPMIDSERQDRLPKFTTENMYFNSHFNLLGINNDALEMADQRTRSATVMYIVIRAIQEYQKRNGPTARSIIERANKNLSDFVAHMKQNPNLNLKLNTKAKEDLTKALVSLLSDQRDGLKYSRMLRSVIDAGAGMMREDEIFNSMASGEQTIKDSDAYAKAAVAQFVNGICSLPNTTLYQLLAAGRVSTAEQLETAFFTGLTEMRKTMTTTARDLTSDDAAMFSSADDYTCVGLSYFYKNVFKPLATESNGQVAYQYMGGGEATARVTLQGKDNAVTSLRTRLDLTSEQIRLYTPAGYFKVRNSMLEMLGLGHCLVSTASTETVGGFPGEYEIQINMAEYDPGQALKEQMQPVAGFLEKYNDIINVAIEGSTAKDKSEACSSLSKRIQAADRLPEGSPGQTDLLNQLQSELNKQMESSNSTMAFFKSKDLYKDIAYFQKYSGSFFDLSKKKERIKALDMLWESGELWKTLAAAPERFMKQRTDEWQPQGGILDLIGISLKEGFKSVDGKKVDISIASANKGLMETKEGLMDLEAYPDLALPRFSEVVIFLLKKNMPAIKQGLVSFASKYMPDKRADKFADQTILDMTGGVMNSSMGPESQTPLVSTRRMDELMRQFSQDGVSNVPLMRALFSTINDNGGRYVDPDFYMQKSTTYAARASEILRRHASYQNLYGDDGGSWLLDRFGGNLHLGNLQKMELPLSEKQDQKKQLAQMKDIELCLQALSDKQVVDYVEDKSSNQTLHNMEHTGAGAVIELVPPLFAAWYIKEEMDRGHGFKEAMANMIKAGFNASIPVSVVRSFSTALATGDFGEAALAMINRDSTSMEFGDTVLLRMKHSPDFSKLYKEMEEIPVEGRKLVLLQVQRSIGRMEDQTKRQENATASALDALKLKGSAKPGAFGKTDFNSSEFTNAAYGVILENTSILPGDEGNKWTAETVARAYKDGPKYVGKPIESIYMAAPMSGVNESNAGLLIDDIYYSGKDRLIRAFPTMKLLFINEYTRTFGIKFWTDVFTYSAVTSCVISRHRDRAADTCMIELSNVYKTLQPQMDKAEEAINDLRMNIESPRFGTKEKGVGELLGRIGVEAWNWTGQLLNDTTAAMRLNFHMLSDEEFRQLLMAKIMSRYMNHYLRPGVRFQVRIGYSGNVWSLKNRFTGTVKECSIGEQVTIIGEGDGAELTNRMGWNAFDEPKMLGRGADARSFLLGMMAAKGEFGSDASGWAEIRNIQKAGAIYDTNPYGIYHFGSILYADSGYFSLSKGAAVATRYAAVGAGIGFVGTGLAGGFFAGLLGAGVGFTTGFFTSQFRGPDRVGLLEMETNFYSPNPYNYVDGGDWLYTMNHLISWTDNNDLSFQPAAAGHSFWTLSGVFADVAMDYIRVAEPFEFRSTFFFGKPYWNYACEYFYPESEKKYGRMVAPGHVTNISRLSQLHYYQQDISTSTYEGAVTGGITNMIGGLLTMKGFGGAILAVPMFAAGLVQESIGLYLQVKNWDQMGTQQYKPSGEVIIPQGFYDAYADPNKAHTFARAIQDPMAVLGAASFYKNMQPWERMGMVYKPYQQLHVITSQHDIIRNGIRASDKELYNVVEARTLQTYKNPHGYAQTNTVYADDDIYPEHQKKISVLTGIVTKATLSTPVIRWIMSTTLGSADQTVAIGRARLRDYMKQMYQGVIVQIGNPAVKPHDYQYVCDDRHGMYGLSQVRGVVDIISMRDGYITVVEPDACVYGTDRDTLKVWQWCASYAKEEYAGRQVDLQDGEDYREYRRAFNVSLVESVFGEPEWKRAAVLAGSGYLSQWFTPVSVLQAAARFVGRGQDVKLTGAAGKKGLKGKMGTQYVKVKESVMLARRNYMMAGDPALISAQESLLSEAEAFATKYQTDFDEILRSAEAGETTTKIRGKVSVGQYAQDAESLLNKFDTVVEGQRAADQLIDLKTADGKVFNKYLGNGKFRGIIDAEFREMGLNPKVMSPLEKANRLHMTPSGNRMIIDHMAAAEEKRIASGLGGDMKALAKYLRIVKVRPQAIKSTVNFYSKLDMRLGQSIEKAAATKYGKSLMNMMEGAGIKKAETAALARAGIRNLIGGMKIGATIIAVETVNQLVNNWAAGRQAIVVMPMTVNGVEFSAGMEGHQGCVVGDSLGFYDQAVNSLVNWSGETYDDLSGLGDMGAPPLPKVERPFSTIPTPTQPF